MLIQIQGRLLCRLNGLPPSTLRTTPHLLHTRTVLTLPPSARAPSAVHEEDAAQRARHVRERAEKRLQTLTKELDWRVAKAYVAIADMHDPDDDDADAKVYEDAVEKRRELKRAAADVEERALDRYLDDDEWEKQERRAGRRVALPAFPYLSKEGVRSGHWQSNGRPWWRW